MRVIVCGGRDYDDCMTLRRAMFSIHEGPEGPITMLFHGNARGADTEAARWAREFGIKNFACPADWAKHGKAAGPIRNKNMLGNHIDLVIAFPGGRGTANMIKQAKAAGVRVVEFAHTAA